MQFRRTEENLPATHTQNLDTRNVLELLARKSFEDCAELNLTKATIWPKQSSTNNMLTQFSH